MCGLSLVAVMLAVVVNESDRDRMSISLVVVVETILSLISAILVIRLALLGVRGHGEGEKFLSVTCIAVSTLALWTLIYAWSDWIDLLLRVFNRLSQPPA